MRIARLGEVPLLQEVEELSGLLRPSWRPLSDQLTGPVNLEIFPDEWLDHMIGIVPRADHATNFPVPATLYMGLFTAGTASSVPVRGTTTPNNGNAAVVEPNGTAYARITMAAAVWGSTITTSGNGRRITASQQTFAESGAAWNTSAGTPAGVIKGFFIANALTNGKAVYYANFDDGQPIDINAAGYTVKVTPFIQYDG